MVTAWLLEVVRVMVAWFWNCRRGRLKQCCWVFEWAKMHIYNMFSCEALTCLPLKVQ